ncbi:indole-3-glycerol phosphate synthase TrpC [soil metagenome]
MATAKLNDRLKEILAHKRTEVEDLLPRAEKLRLAALERNDFRSLHAALLRGEEAGGGLGLIAEVKRASPSAGVIVEDFDPVAVAKAYDAAGASAISVLTDEKYFGGRLEYLTQIRSEVGVPCLRKDFILHEAQIWEASVAGADAILLIVAALGQDELIHLLEVAETFQLDALVEIHDAEELERALETRAKIIGINNRNLRTFEVDLKSTEKLAQDVPDGIVLVSESGIRSEADARLIEGWGADAVLVGEALMRSGDVGGMARALMGVGERVGQ